MAAIRASSVETRLGEPDFRYGAANAQRQICTYAIEVHRFSLYQMQVEGKDWSKSPLLQFENQLSMVEDSIALDNLREQAARGGTLKKVTRARRKLRSIDKRVETGKRKFIDAARSYAASFPASLQEYVEHGTEDGYLNRFILADLVAPSPLVKLSSPLPSSPNRQKLHGRKPQPYLAQLRATSAAQESNRWISKATLFGIQESSRAEYLWRETRDDKVRDLEILRYLAGLFGPLETSIFSASLFPGESYRCLVHAAASKIQSWWRPFPNYLHNLRHSAASLIQKRARIAAMRRKNNEYDRIVRRCLGRMMHRRLSATFESERLLRAAETI